MTYPEDTFEDYVRRNLELPTSTEKEKQLFEWYVKHIVAITQRWVQKRLDDLGNPEYGPYSCDRCDIGQTTLKALIEDLALNNQNKTKEGT